jgi:hypothetical protein
LALVLAEARPPALLALAPLVLVLADARPYAPVTHWSRSVEISYHEFLF